MTRSLLCRATGHSSGTLALLATLTGVFGIVLTALSNPAYGSTYTAQMPDAQKMAGVNPNRPVVVERDQVVPEVVSAVGDVEVYGTVEGDVRSTMGDVLVRGPVGGGVESGLGDIEVEAPVGGDIETGFGDVYIDAFVGGDVEVERGDVILGPGADISGDIFCGTGRCSYDRSSVDGQMMSGTMNGAVLGEMESPEVADGGVFRWLLGAGLLCGASLLLTVLAPAQVAASARMVESHPVWSLLVGMGSVIGAAVVSVLLAISVIGLPLLILVGPLYFGLIAFGAVVAAFFVGRMVVLRIGGYRQGNVLAAVIGAVAVAALVLLPMGEILLALISILGAGAALMALLRGSALFRKYLPGKGFDQG